MAGVISGGFAPMWLLLLGGCLIKGGSDEEKSYAYLG